MPFTFSHPAAVLPFSKTRRLSFAALVAGSVAPDFEYFIHMKSTYSHTLWGILWLDIPMAILVAFLFFNIAKDSLIDNLPSVFRNRLSAVRDFNWNRHFREHWLMVVICVAAGIFTHIVWDSFTHRTGYFVQRIAALRGEIVSIPVYRLLQHASTLLGAFIILVFIMKQPVIKKAGKINPAYWLLIIVITAVCALTALKSVNYIDIWRAAVILIASTLVSLLVTPVLLRIKDI